jgi:hypothetical protein
MYTINNSNNNLIWIKIIFGVFSAILILYFLNMIYTHLQKTNIKQISSLEPAKELSNDSQLPTEIPDTFLDLSCTKKKCFNAYEPCYSANGFDVNQSGILNNIIERTTVKAIMNLEDKYKLMNLSQYLTPSMMNGTFCDIVFSSYYDFPDRYHTLNRIFKTKKDISKAIRIRHYHFEPNTYFELKYDGVKIRTMIDNEYNILNPEKIDPKYKELVMSLLDKIKSGDLKLLFKNTYKRLSFIYKENSSIRMTMDTAIEFDYKGDQTYTDFDIFELKYPKDMEYSTITEYMDEINEKANTNLEFRDFSKVEYIYHHAIDKK